ncbi:hypothetical protein [Staphylococcus aureus]|uniref:hypothetical protein n=1 Tax=Staphylococcus aureus TaxID=1280 RepID=UPI00168175D5|nr:hypothetical protein [Staphylococcus aureus]MBD1782138.1 hypothetical protein [Staphylococcus aureus]
MEEKGKKTGVGRKSADIKREKGEWEGGAEGEEVGEEKRGDVPGKRGAGKEKGPPSAGGGKGKEKRGREQ